MMTVEDEEEEEVEEDARAEGREKQGYEGETPQTLAISTTPRLSGDDTDGALFFGGFWKFYGVY